jgi:phosphohistidine phosphatase
MTAPRLILVRHAHAEWPNYRGPDFDRPLTPQGEAGARATGRAIREAGFIPALLLASSARRTRQTAEIIAEELQLPPAVLRFSENLYNAPDVTLQLEVQSAAPATGLLMMVAHNPGVSELARVLADDIAAPNYRPGDWRVLPLPGPGK